MLRRSSFGGFKHHFVCPFHFLCLKYAQKSFTEIVDRSNMLMDFPVLLSGNIISPPFNFLASEMRHQLPAEMTTKVQTSVKIFSFVLVLVRTLVVNIMANDMF